MTFNTIKQPPKPNNNPAACKKEKRFVKHRFKTKISKGDKASIIDELTEDTVFCAVNKKIAIGDLNLTGSNRLLFSLYNKKDAEHYGGFNLFGKNFGNYEQDIVLSAIYDEPVLHR